MKDKCILEIFSGTLSVAWAQEMGRNQESKMTEIF